MLSNIIDVISEEKPTGSDYKYEDDYIAIESEIDKTMSASGAADVDWKLIKENSEEILVTKSKDLKIASYWLFAQWKLNSLEGLERYLPSYQALIEEYTTELFPKSVKVKLRILEWLQESLTIPLLQQLHTLDEKKIQGLIASFEALEASILKAFSNDELRVFSSLIRKFKKVLDERVSLKKLNELDKKVEETVQKVENKEPANVAKVEMSQYNLNDHLQGLQEQLRGLTQGYAAFELTQILGFEQLNRSFLEEKPLDRTCFPSDDELKEVKSLEAKKCYLDALKNLVVRYPVWLEGMYLIIIRIDNSKLLEQDKIILNNLKYKLIMFINNNEKNLHNCAPKDHSIVNELIKKWVNLEKKSLTLSNINSVFEEEYENALRLYKGKNKEEAIVLLDKRQKNSNNSKEAFLWRLKQARLALKIGNGNMVVALLRELDREIEAFNLMKWDPDLAIEVYVLILKPSISKILNLEKKELFYRKLCRLSPKDAMNIGFL